jgi:hypothetical protein
MLLESVVLIVGQNIVAEGFRATIQISTYYILVLKLSKISLYIIYQRISSRFCYGKNFINLNKTDTGIHI